MLKLNYDTQYDILYLGIADNSSSYGAETIDHVNVFRDLFSDEITGYMIIDFKKKYETNKLPLLDSPQYIDFERDVLPKVLQLN